MAKEIEPEEKQVSGHIQDFVMTPILFPGQMANYEQEAERRLKDSALLDWINEVLSQRIVGENDTKLLLFLIALSYKADEPQSCIISGPPSTGKSYLCRNVLRLMPNVINVSRMTPAFLDRIGSDLSHCILYVSELGGAEQSLPTLRVMLSEGELILGTTDRNEKGKIETVIIETKGSPVYVTTTHQEIVERQLASRTWLLNMDTSPEQTRQILRYQGKLARSAPLPEYTREEMTLRTLVYMLKPYNIIIPYTEKLSELFPSTETQARRDFKRLLSLIETITLLFQRQRVALKLNGEEYLMASLTDLAHALKLIKPVLLPTLYGLPQKAFELLKIFQEAGALVEFAVKDIAAKTALSDNRARAILNGLVDRGFLHKDISAKTHHYSWTGKNLEDGTILSTVASSEFFSQTEFEKWLNENRVGSSTDSKRLYETYILPNALLWSEHPQQLEEKPKSTVLERDKPKDVTITQTVASSKISGAVTIDNILGWLRLEFQQGNNPVLRCISLNSLEKGTCPLCGKHNVNLPWQIQFVDDTRIDVCCLDCGGRIDEEVRLFLEKESAS